MFRWQKGRDFLTAKQDMGDILREGNKSCLLFSREAHFSSQLFSYVLVVLNSLSNAPSKTCKNTQVSSKDSSFFSDEVGAPEVNCSL